MPKILLGHSCQNQLRRAALCLFAIVCCTDALGAGNEPAAQPWGYHIGETGKARQGNFCEDSDAALEIARIFERFGARTGFSALSNAPSCSTRVHAVTPESLLYQVEIKLEGGASYVVKFIQVRANDGTRPILVTTRQFIED